MTTGRIKRPQSPVQPSIGSAGSRCVEIWVSVPEADQQSRLVLVAKRIDEALNEARQTVDDLEELQSKQLDFELYKLLKELT